jgi:hypothetical protein
MAVLLRCIILNPAAIDTAHDFRCLEDSLRDCVEQENSVHMATSQLLNPSESPGRKETNGTTNIIWRGLHRKAKNGYQPKTAEQNPCANQDQHKAHSGRCRVVLLNLGHFKPNHLTAAYWTAEHSGPRGLAALGTFIKH